MNQQPPVNEAAALSKVYALLLARAEKRRAQAAGKAQAKKKPGK